MPVEFSLERVAMEGDEDREPFHGWVMRSAPRGNAVQARVLDAEILIGKSDLLAEAVVLGLEPDASVEVMLGVGPDNREGDARHRDDGDHDQRTRRGHALGSGIRIEPAELSIKSLRGGAEMLSGSE